MPQHSFEQRWNEACAELRRTDRVLARLIERYPGERLEPHGDLFRTLARAIVGQQISVMAAEKIWKRIEDRAETLLPRAFLAAGKEALLNCGRTRRKADYLTALAESYRDSHQLSTGAFTVDGPVLHADLLALHGVGRGLLTWP